MTKPAAQNKKKVPEPDSPKPKKKPGDNAYLKYSGMAFQMAGSILLFALLGRWLDGFLETGQIMTIVLTLFGVFVGLYLALKDFL